MKTYLDFTEDEKQEYKNQLKIDVENYITNYYKQVSINVINYLKPLLGNEFEEYFDKRLLELKEDE